MKTNIVFLNTIVFTRSFGSKVANSVLAHQSAYARCYYFIKIWTITGKAVGILMKTEALHVGPVNSVMNPMNGTSLKKILSVLAAKTSVRREASFC